MKNTASVLFSLLVMSITGQVGAAPLMKVDLVSDTAWTLSVDGGEPRSIKVTAGGWNSDRQELRIPSASVKDHVIYEREIVIPNAARGSVVKVEFGGCNYGAEVFLDGRRVAEHHTPMTPFDADLTDYVEPGKTCLLRVKAYTRFHYGKFGQPTSVTAGFDFNKGMSPFRKFDGHTRYAYGLTGHVRLAVYPPVHISDVFVRTSVENRTLAYDVWIANGSEEDRMVSLEASLVSWSPRQYDYPALPPRTIIVKAGRTRKITVKDIAWNLGTESYWWPNIPFREDYRAILHWLKLSMTEKGKAMHRTRRRFGFVEYCEGSYYYTVNGVRFTSMGDSNSYGQVGEYDCWSQTPCFLPPDGAYKGCPETWKRYQRIGFNSMRLSTSVPTRHMLDTADEAGYMLIPEGGSWGNGTCTFDKERFSAQLQGMIRFCRNHPSVARYSMANESFSGDGGQWRWLIDAAVESDPTRPYVFEVNPGIGAGKVAGMKAGHAYRMQHYDPIVQGGDFIRGMGECCWTTGGMGPFGSAAREFRLKDWAHFAPWSWLNFWPNFLEGMNHRRHPWKYNNHPDRKDNVDGWGSLLVTHVQRSLHPYLILDYQHLSAGFPQSNQTPIDDTPTYLPGERIERRIEVFNGGLFGNKMQLRWSAKWDSPDGPVIERCKAIGPFTVEPGFHTAQTLAFTAPSLQPHQTDRRLYLLLESIKDEEVVFLEDALWFRIGRDKWFTVDDNDPAVTYSAGWKVWKGNPCYRATEHYADQPGATATFTFTGSKAIFYGLKRHDLGVAEVFVDGRLAQTLDLYQPQGLYTKLYETDELSDGEHRIDIKVQGRRDVASRGRYVIVDAFQFAATNRRND